MAVLFDDINRLITIEAPQTEITCQNLLNAIRGFEYSDVGIDDPQVASAAGKEALGGGVYVGITVTLYNWKVQFEARSGPDWTTCSISGGNLVAVDGDGDFMSPIEPAAYVTVLITASSSATLSELGAIQYSSFDGGVTIDIVNGVAGTAYNIGTPENPVNNTTDALTIAATRGFTAFYAIGDITLDTGTDFDEKIFVGESPTKSVITISDAADVENCEFYDAQVTGVLDGGNVLNSCLIINLNYVNGYIENCILGNGTITLDGGGDAHFLDCWSGVAGTGTPIIDMGGSGQNLGVRNYNGDIKLANKTGTDSVSLDINSGQVVLASTVTNGTIVCRGIGKLIDESGDNIPTGTWNGATILNESINLNTITDSIWDSALADHEVANTFGKIISDMIKLTGYKVTKSGDVITIYESNGSTVWRQYNLANGGRVEV